MFFRCPACHAKSIFFPTLFLHVWGAKEHARSNRFECTRCHRLLGSFYSPVPFFLLGALAQLFVLQSGGVRDLWIGGLLFALLALFWFPIRERPEREQDSLFAAVRRFRDPIDQGVFYIESRLLSVAAGLLVARLALLLVNQWLPGAQAHAGGLIFLLPVGVAGLLAAFAFSALIYRVGRSNGRLRVALDVALLASVLLQVGAL